MVAVYQRDNQFFTEVYENYFYTLVAWSEYDRGDLQ